MGTEQADVTTFVAQHGQALLGFAFVLCSGRAADAEDAVQAVLERLALRGLDGVANPLAFARRAVVNEFRQRARHDGVHHRTLPRLLPVDPSPGDGVEDRMVLATASRGLSEREREVLTVRYLLDLDDQAIADLLGCPRSTVRSLARRGLQHLRTVLEPEEAR